MSRGWSSIACAAGPPSPAKPGVVPASVTIVPLVARRGACPWAAGAAASVARAAIRSGRRYIVLANLRGIRRPVRHVADSASVNPATQRPYACAVGQRRTVLLLIVAVLASGLGLLARERDWLHDA